MFDDDTHLMSYNYVSYDVIQYLASIQIMELAMNFNRCMYWGLSGGLVEDRTPDDQNPSLKMYYCVW